MNVKTPAGRYMTEEEIRVEGLILMVATTNTTAVFFASLVKNALSNPVLHKTLRNEI